ncbi:MAG: T9SS type A sorting domain-containing protein, partial [Flavobacteriales bacterium]|nr:T9SS type A sorting domain-containing protein [Flavobacteriales bacterium]
FTVFPVPTSDILFINLQSEVDNNIIINITDLRGRVLSTIEHDGGGGLDVIDFNTSSLDAGTYIIEAVSDNVRSVTRFEVLR